VISLLAFAPLKDGDWHKLDVFRSAFEAVRLTHVAIRDAAIGDLETNDL
jgi:hypothetical protein